MSFPVSGFEFAPMTVTLYEVHALEGDQFCETCFRIRRAYLNGDNYPLEELSPGNTAWWMFGSSSEMSVRTFGEAREGVLRIKIGNTPCGDPRTVEIRSGSTQQVTTLSGQETVEIDVPLDHRAVEQNVEFYVEGATCRIDGDNRDFNLQIFQPQLILDE
jgi:hypothetical protein